MAQNLLKTGIMALVMLTIFAGFVEGKKSSHQSHHKGHGKHVWPCPKDEYRVAKQDSCRPCSSICPTADLRYKPSIKCIVHCMEFYQQISGFKLKMPHQAAFNADTLNIEAHPSHQKQASFTKTSGGNYTFKWIYLPIVGAIAFIGVIVTVCAVYKWKGVKSQYSSTECTDPDETTGKNIIYKPSLRNAVKFSPSSKTSQKVNNTHEPLLPLLSQELKQIESSERTSNSTSAEEHDVEFVTTV